jgi:predicted O-methyltransferase YrrM
VDTKNTNRGLEILEEAGIKSLVEFHGEKSHLALPQFLKEGRQFDLAFVDGNHRLQMRRCCLTTRWNCPCQL